MCTLCHNTKQSVTRYTTIFNWGGNMFHHFTPSARYCVRASSSSFPESFRPIQRIDEMRQSERKMSRLGENSIFPERGKCNYFVVLFGLAGKVNEKNVYSLPVATGKVFLIGQTSASLWVFDNFSDCWWEILCHSKTDYGSKFKTYRNVHDCKSYRNCHQHSTP